MRRRLDRYAGLRNRLGGGDPDAEARDELEHHLELRIAEYEASGMTPVEARRQALKRMGDMERYAEETARIDALRSREHRRRAWVSGSVRELRQAVRALSRSPWFALAAILTLGIGFGATASVGTLLDRVVVRALPYPDSDRLVWVASRVNGLGYNGEWGLSEAGYFDYRKRATRLDDLGAFVRTSMTISGDDAAERVPAVLLTSSLQSVLRFRPFAGRLLSEADDAPGSERVVLLSYGFWQRRYGGDRSVIGQVVDLNTSPAEIVGVLSPGDGLPDTEADVWLPVGFDPAARPVNSHYVRAIGRLAEGATVEAAQAELDRLTAMFPELYPTAYSPSFMEDAQFRADVVPLRDHVLGDSARLLWILFGSVALVFVLACANVANLFLVRAEVRRREAAVRSALGGGRLDLAVHYTTESLVVAVAAGLLGLAIAYGVVSWLQGTSAGDIPRLAEVRLGGSAFAMIGLAVVATGVAFGAFPLLRAGRDSGDVLRGGGRGVSTSRHQNRIRSILVAGQIAIALTLLAGAGVMVRSYARLRAVDPGFDAERLLTVELNLPPVRYGADWETTFAFHRTLIERVTSISGVRAAATSTVLPLTGPGPCASMFTDDAVPNPGEEPPCLAYRLVSPGWFDVMGMELNGRAPAWEDAQQGSGAVVVTDAVRRTFWPSGAAIGRGIKSNGAEPPFYRVSAVAADIRGAGLDAPPMAEVYFPLRPMEGAPLWSPPTAFTLAVRTAGADPLAVLPAIRTIVADLDADVPIADARSMEAVVARSLARESFTLTLLSVAAGMALVLSNVGLYGLIAYVVSQRRAEIGVRMALGASTISVTRMVVGQTLALAAAGIVIGVGLTVLSTGAMRALLYEVSPADPITLVVVSLVLAGLAAAASWGPARNASRVDPMEVMRAE